MNHFSDVSKTRLFTCHRDLQTLFNHVIIDYDCTIVCGHRDKADQNKAFAEKKSTKQYPNSKHNHIPSMAVDAAPYELFGIDWTPKQMSYFAGYVRSTADMLYRLGIMKHRIRCGIDWDSDNDIDDETFIDMPHFELVLNETDK